MQTAIFLNWGKNILFVRVHSVAAIRIQFLFYQLWSDKYKPIAFGPTICTNPTAKQINTNGKRIQQKNCRATENSTSSYIHILAAIYKEGSSRIRIFKISFIFSHSPYFELCRLLLNSKTKTCYSVKTSVMFIILILASCHLYNHINLHVINVFLFKVWKINSS